MEKKKFDKKYSNDVTRNICVIFYLHNRKYFTCPCSLVHVLTVICSQVSIVVTSL